MICGVQHFGITVSDMERSLKFYIDILGGKLITSGMGFKGPEIHRSLLQRDEELGAPSICGVKFTIKIRLINQPCVKSEAVVIIWDNFEHNTFKFLIEIYIIQYILFN